jgi:UDP-glucose 4-epimerase
MQHSRFGVVNWFVRLAMDNAALQVYGDGSILRDFCYVDDCVEAILRLAIEPSAYGQIFNVGSDIPVSFLELVKVIVDAAKQGSWEFAEFSPERKAQEPGDFYSDISKIERFVGWRPAIDLETGIAKTIDYYSKHRDHYWTSKAQAKIAEIGSAAR